MEQTNVYLDQLLKLLVDYAPKVAIALLLLVVGWWAINRFSKYFKDYLDRTEHAPPEVESFVHSIVELGLKIFLVISVAGILGIETTSIVGILAAMGFAVGLALQGNLSNFAAGVLILIMRPYRVGDEVKISGKWLFVKEIQIFHTVFKEMDNTMTIIPNSSVLNGPIQNMTALPNRKIAIKVNVPYTEDFFKVKKLVIDTAFSFEEIDENIKPFMFLKDYGEHYIKLSLSFAMNNPKHYWVVNPKLNDAIIKALYDNNIKTAYPRGVVHGSYGGVITEEASTFS
ncbi:MAG: mechanosensitive ion channel family protein [Chitinophagales bacterium]